MQAELSTLLTRAGDGDQEAARLALAQVYDRLRQMARRYVAAEPGGALSATTLVHETYLSLFGGKPPQWQDAAHFFGYAATAMRHILVDAARHRASRKRGHDFERVDVDLTQIEAGAPACDLIALDQALRQLESLSPRLVQVVDLHVFAGMSFADIATHLRLTERTVFRDWRKARAFLHEHLGVS